MFILLPCLLLVCVPHVIIYATIVMKTNSHYLIERNCKGQFAARGPFLLNKERILQSSGLRMLCSGTLNYFQSGENYFMIKVIVICYTNQCQYFRYAPTYTNLFQMAREGRQRLRQGLFITNISQYRIKPRDLNRFRR